MSAGALSSSEACIRRNPPWGQTPRRCRADTWASIAQLSNPEADAPLLELCSIFALAQSVHGEAFLVSQNAPQPSVQCGAVIAGKFKVLRVLGEGGMGVVLLAHHLDLERPV